MNELNEGDCKVLFDYRYDYEQIVGLNFWIPRPRGGPWFEITDTVTDANKGADA